MTIERQRQKVSPGALPTKKHPEISASQASPECDTKEIKAHIPENPDCADPNDNQIGFVINQVDDNRFPKSIEVTFTEPAQEDNEPATHTYTVGLTTTTGPVGHYNFSHPQPGDGWEITTGDAEIYKEWGGQFNLSHVQCSPDQIEGITHLSAIRQIMFQRPSLLSL